MKHTIRRAFPKNTVEKAILKGLFKSQPGVQTTLQRRAQSRASGKDDALSSFRPVAINKEPKTEPQVSHNKDDQGPFWVAPLDKDKEVKTKPQSTQEKDDDRPLCPVTVEKGKDAQAGPMFIPRENQPENQPENHPENHPAWSLRGKVALIAGGTSSIGTAVAQRFAREGVSVIMAGRSSDKLSRAFIQLIQQAQAQHKWAHNIPQGVPHKTARLDVSVAEDWSLILKRHPKIDILVNCAGVSQEKLLLRTDETEIEQILSANLRGVILGSKMVGRAMLKQKSGVIVNVSSLLAQRGIAGTSVYAAAKAGQLGLTTALAQEYGHFGVRVNAVVPGFIDTSMTKNLTNRDEILEKIPLKRFGTPDEVADAVTFLAGNPYANNCILNLDGGLSA